MVSNSEKPDVVDDPDVIDYDSMTIEVAHPFKFALGGERYEVAWPLASTKRALTDALRDNRYADAMPLMFGHHWPAIDVALDARGPDGDELQSNLVADALEHFGMSEQTIAKYRANREQRRAQRRSRRGR